MNWKVISRNIGYALLVSALFMLLSVIVSISEGNDSALAALAISFTITFIVGVFPFIFVRKSDVISLKEGYVIITLSWLMSFIFGMLPYALWGGPFSLVNAWFESVSGFTTCGSTILDDVEVLPKSLLFWRSSTHFIGGLGVVVFLLLIIPESSPMRMRLTNMELTSLSRSGYSSRTNKVVYIFAYVYIAIAVAAFLAYLLAGMSLFDAVCHAMSVVSTGGFKDRFHRGFRLEVDRRHYDDIHVFGVPSFRRPVYDGSDPFFEAYEESGVQVLYDIDIGGVVGSCRRSSGAWRLFRLG